MTREDTRAICAAAAAAAACTSRAWIVDRVEAALSRHRSISHVRREPACVGAEVISSGGGGSLLRLGARSSAGGNGARATGGLRGSP